MTTPQLPPMLKPFEQAVAFLRERRPETAEVYAELDSDTRLRSFTIAGLAKRAALEEAQRLAVRSAAEGMTVQEFNNELADLIEANGGTLLSPARLDLIFRNVNAIGASAGRYRQIIEGGIAESRPFGQYPLGPDDAHTSAICRRLQGLVFPLRSMLARRIWPPNHHAERHLNVTTLTAEQARASGRLYEGDPEEYPFLEDPETGQAARVMPSPGFDFDPASLLSADGKHLESAANALDGEEIERKTAADYKLAPLSAARLRKLPSAPITLRESLGRKTDNAWAAFQDHVGIRRAEASGVIADFLGEGVVVTRESFDRVSGSRGAGYAHENLPYFSWIVPTIQAPFEAWLVPHASPDETEVRFVRRYIGLFRSVDQIVAAVIDRSPEGWLMRAAFYAAGELPEHERRGLLTSTKSKRKR